MTAQLQELAKLLGPNGLSTEASDLKEYGRDWVKHFEPKPLAISFPRSTAEVREIVLWGRRNRIGLVPSGGRTGLSGGACALNGELVVSFAKMNRILEFNDFDQTLSVESGVITETIQQIAIEKGFYYPVDFASRGSSQIGGNVATNAGGIKVLRYGLTRNWVAALEVVTGTGEILELNHALVKNATGYDLRHLMVGSEGTLGLITRVTVQLTRQPPPLNLFVFGVADLAAVMKVYHTFRRSLPLTAFEMFTDLALECVLTHHSDLKSPLSERAPYYVLVEFESAGNENVDRALELFSEGLEQGWITDGVQAQNAQQAKDLWRLREDISEATAPFTPYKNDISVRIACVPEFLQEMDAILQKNYPTYKVVWFGHIGDGNLHINILKPSDLSTAEFLHECKRVDETLFAMIEKFKGSISAEHGVGLTKKAYLGHSRSPAELSLLRQIKSVFDPDGIMNPGKLI